MTKRAPSDVVEHRISLQDKLSSQVDSLVAAESVKDYADAIDKLASFENLYVAVTIAELITGKEILPGTPNDLYQLIDWVRDWMASTEGWGEDGFIPSDPGEALAPGGEYSGLEGFFRFVWERATVFGWASR